MKKVRVLFFIVVSLLVCIPVNVNAKKETERYHLNAIKLKLQLGNTYDLYLMDSENDDERIYNDWYYGNECKWSSSAEDIVSVTEYGEITVEGIGKAVINAEYEGKNYKCKITTSDSKYKLSTHEIETKTFITTEFNMTHGKKVSYYDYDIYEIKDNLTKEKTYEGFNINTDSSTGLISIEPNRPGKYSIDFYAVIENYEDYSLQRYKDSCTINVELHGLIDKEIGIALGTSKQLTFDDLDNIVFNVEDEAIAAVDEKGVVSPVSVGETHLYMRGMNDEGMEESYTCIVEVSDPEVSMDNNYVRVENYIYPNISNSSYYGETIYSSSDNEILNVYESSVYAKSEGKATLYITVDGREFELKIEVVNPRLENNRFLMVPSSTEQIKLVGLNKALKKEKITYKVDNKKIAKVSEDGIITARKCGCTTLTITFGDFILTAAISIGKEKAVNAVKNAEKAIGASYSQEKRMQQGFYDCSSLVWRSYSPCGVDFGSHSYAPTAADTAKYMDEHGKTISYSLIEVEKLQPGDLVFYAYENNNRFMNISHVSIFAGISPDSYYNDYYYYDDYYSETSGDIIHATSSGVIRSILSEGYGPIVLIARPTNKDKKNE